MACRRSSCVRNHRPAVVVPFRTRFNSSPRASVFGIVEPAAGRIFGEACDCGDRNSRSSAGRRPCEKRVSWARGPSSKMRAPCRWVWETSCASSCMPRSPTRRTDAVVEHQREPRNDSAVHRVRPAPCRSSAARELSPLSACRTMAVIADRRVLGRCRREDTSIGRVTRCTAEIEQPALALGQDGRDASDRFGAACAPFQ